MGLFGDKVEIKLDEDLGLVIGPDGCHYNDEQEAMWCSVLKFCACGPSDDVHNFVCECLQTFDRDYRNWHDSMEMVENLVAKNSRLAAYFIAYALDVAELLEHGSSIGGSVLTERGRQFIDIGPMGIEN